MMPAGPLMIEHRLIERMISLMKNEVAKIGQEDKADPDFLDKALDFIITYADKCHHGKEEDILFRDLAKKQLSAEHKNMLQGLIQDHSYGRKTTGELSFAKEKYMRGNKNALQEIVARMQELIIFYPKHIEKEDKYFFLPCMNYLNKEEQADMLKEFREFDRKLIHEKYGELVKKIEKQRQL